MFRSLRHWPTIFRALRSSQGHALPPRRARRRFSPHCLPLEQLEGRSVPSVITLLVTSPADSGNRTLRDAITTADAGATTDSYVIKIVSPETITLESVLPDLSRNITITGSASGKTTVQRDPTAPPFRIFRVDAGETVSISGLTIAGGNAGSGSGGGIDNSGTLTVSNTTFTGNSADFDGGGISNLGTATVSDSTFTSNSAGAFGGGLENAGTATVSDSTFTSNSASEAGGGLESAGTATVSVSDSSFTSNSAGVFGGGLTNFGTATVSDSSFTSNSALFGFGGGLANFGTATVSDSSFTSNSAGVFGGGLFNDFGGTATVSGSTFTSNSAGTDGGGIYNFGTLTPQPPQDFNTFKNNHPNDVGP